MSKNTILFVIMLFVLFFAAKTFSAPYAQNGNLYVYQYQASPPSWYVSSASQGTLYTYAYPSSPSATVRLYTTRYSFATVNYWLNLLNGQIYSGASYDGDNYEYRLTASGTTSASYTWSATVDGFYVRVNGTGTVSFYIRFAVTDNNVMLQNITLIVYANGTQVGRFTVGLPSNSYSSSLDTGWGTASFSTVQGVYKISFYLYVRSGVTNDNVNCVVEADAISVSGTYLVSYSDVSATLSYSSSTASGLQTRVVYTASFQGANYSKLVGLSPSPASYTYTSSTGTLTVLTVTAYYNAQTQSLASGTVPLPKPSGYSVLQYIARAPQGYYIVTNSSTPEYLDEAYAPGTATALQVTLVQPSWKTVYTLAQKYIFSVLNSSTTSIGSVLLPAGKYLVFTSKADAVDNCYLKLNSSLLYSASFLNNTSLAPPQSGTSPITFTVQDYGAGYQVLEVADLQGRIVESSLIGSTGQVAMNLTPYASYMITVCKSGVCKSVGLVTISSSNIQLSVIPSTPTVTQPSLASASYDYTNKALRVNVSCTAPPCTVNIYKSVIWYNYWQMRLPVSLSQGWNLVFLKKSSTVSASGMWAYINNTDWSEIRFGDSSGLPNNFLNYSIIWSNTTHAQVLVYAPSSGTYYLYWQPQIQVPYANVTNPLIQCVNGRCGLSFDGVNDYVEVPHSPSYTATRHTVMVTFMPVSSNYFYFSKGGWGYYRLLMYRGSYLGLRLTRRDTTNFIFPDAMEPKPNAWTTIAYWLDEQNASVKGAFKDGAFYTPSYTINPSYPLCFECSYPLRIMGDPGYIFYPGYVTQLLIYTRILNNSEIQWNYNNPDNPVQSGLGLWFKADPRYLYDVNWDGYADWIDLSGNGNNGVLYNFHSRGSFTNAPQRQPYNMLVISQTCNTQLCSYTVNSGDPYFTVIVSDSSGKLSQANTGLSVPLWQSPLGSVVSTIGQTLNLDAWGVNINDFVIFLVGLAIIYGAFTYRNWELGIIVFGVWLTVGTLLLGGSGRLMVPGLSLALVGAAISYMLKREQAP